jgi:hypothetical protein
MIKRPSDGEEFAAIAGQTTPAPPTNVEVKVRPYLSSKLKTFCDSCFTDSTGKVPQELDEKLEWLYDNSQGVLISEHEIIDLLQQPLPRVAKKAEQELQSRLYGIVEKIESRQNNPAFIKDLYREFSHKTFYYDEQLRDLPGLIQELDTVTNLDFNKEVRFIKNQYVIWKKDVREMVNIVGNDPDNFQLQLRFVRRFWQLEKTVVRLIEVQLPRLRQMFAERSRLRRSLQTLSRIHDLSWNKVKRDEQLQKQELSGNFELSEKQRKNPNFMKLLDLLGYRKYCTIGDLCNYLVQAGECKATSASTSKVKAVKRKFRGLRPAGEEGKDYKILKATETHVRDQQALSVGDEIFGLIQGRTKFETRQVIDYIWSKLMVQQVREVIAHELSNSGKKKIHPKSITPEEVASEMDLPVEKIWMFLG